MQQLIKSFEYSLHHMLCHTHRWLAILLATHLWVWHGTWRVSGNYFIHNYHRVRCNATNELRDNIQPVLTDTLTHHSLCIFGPSDTVMLAF